jgi:hypothetical protein
MVTAQIHETFKSFTGDSVAEISQKIATHVQETQIAVKSLSVVDIANSSHATAGNTFVATIGFVGAEPSDEPTTLQTPETYPVSIQVAVLGAYDSGFDDRLLAAEDAIDGSAICHALYLNRSNEFEVAFLLHGHA